MKRSAGARAENLLRPKTPGRVFDELGDGFRLRDVDRVAALHLDDAGFGTLGHGALRRGRDHPIVTTDGENAFTR